jgi:TetR/AcrR family transcriptional regulator, copper-responsive repressor
MLMKMIKETDRPVGCLYVKACQSQHAIGPLAKAQIKRCHSVTIKIFSDWIEKLKRNNSFPREVSTEFAASYLDSQINNASSMIACGEEVNSVQHILDFSLRSFFNHNTKPV